MSRTVDANIAVVVPNWNGADSLKDCLDSLLKQTLKPHIVVVDNGSVDGSLELLALYPDIELIRHRKNKGYAGGVNPGFKLAIDRKMDYVAPFNNDAVADKDWLKNLVEHMDKHPGVGIAACKLLSADGSHLDSTGDYYTGWGLPYPRGRGETDIDKYDADIEIFGASGGASIYRIDMLKEVGLLDEDFFAYYEDVDLSFRAQLAGWKVHYVPAAVVYHQISATSSRIKGFATYQTMKNLPCLMWKNVPARLMIHVFPRFVLAYFLLWGSATARGHAWSSTKGVVMSILLWPKKLIQRRRIQKSRQVLVEYIDSLIVHDLPPNARRLRRLRGAWWRLRGKAA